MQKMVYESDRERITSLVELCRFLSVFFQLAEG
jgi:hypothetical protein